MSKEKEAECVVTGAEGSYCELRRTEFECSMVQEDNKATRILLEL